MLLGKEKKGSLRGYLIRGSTGSFILKLIFTGLSILISITLARTLGAGKYGIYVYALAWVNMLTVPAKLGLDRLLIREVATHQTLANWGLMHGLLRRSNQAVLLSSLGLALGGAVLGRFVFEGSLLATFWLALPLLPVVALTNLRQAAMRGLRRVVLGQLPEMLVQPVVFLFLVGGAYLLFRERLEAPWAMGLQVVAASAAFLIGTTLLLKYLPRSVKQTQPAYQTRLWASSILPLLLISAMNVINSRVDTIMLGAIRGPEVVGIYRVATRGANLITLALLAVNASLAPIVASLDAAKDFKRLQRVVTRSARAILLFSLPVALVLIVFGRWFLLIFGQEFTQASMTLTILCLGQLVSAVMGSVSLLLVMTNHERDASLVIGMSLLINVALNAVLIPRWGLEGAATASAVSVIIRNAVLSGLVKKRIGIVSTALGPLRR